MVPFIDITLILLIIFMVMSPMLVQMQMTVDLPKSKAINTQAEDDVIRIEVTRDGKIKNLQVERKSGDDTFDFAASSAVINAGPFAPLPMYYEKDELTVSVEFKQEK